MFRLSVLLARPRLDEASAIAQRKSAWSTHNSFQRAVGGLPVRWQAYFSHLSHSVSSAVGELLSADMMNSSSMLSTYAASSLKLYRSFVFCKEYTSYYRKLATEMLQLQHEQRHEQ